MGYITQNFKDGMTLEASHLINIENGILSNEEAIKNISASSGNVSNSFSGKVISFSWFLQS